MTNYIKNKSIDYSKANNIPDLRDIGEATWNFISIIYESDWDSLITNKKNISFKQHVTSKFMPKLQKTRIPSNKKKLTNKPASFVKLPPLIPAKTCKKVMEISKFFKKEIKPMEKKEARKSYAQVLSPKTSKILKIKEIFPKLPANKIDNIYRIVNGGNKPKPKLNMTMKGLSRKQVIISMSNDNKTKFMESSSSHITNLNRALKIIKLDIIADFVHIDQAGITIVTNKVVSSLDL